MTSEAKTPGKVGKKKVIERRKSVSKKKLTQISRTEKEPTVFNDCSRFSGLNNEVLWQIFENLDIRDCCILSSVSKYWKDLLNSDKIWYPFYLKIWPGPPTKDIQKKTWKERFVRQYVLTGKSAPLTSKSIPAQKPVKKMKKSVISMPLKNKFLNEEDKFKKISPTMRMMDRRKRKEFKKRSTKDDDDSDNSSSDQEKYLNQRQESLLASDNAKRIKDELIAWFRDHLKLYSSVRIVNDFSSFTNSGVGFLALLHSYDTTIVDYNSFQHGDKKKILEMVFELAEKHLEIPYLLDVDNLDESSSSFLLYMCLFKSKLVQCYKKNSINASRIELHKLKDLVIEKSLQLEEKKNRFEEEIAKFESLKLIPEEYKAEQEYFYHRAELMDKMLMESKSLNLELEKKNQKLREQNNVYAEKIKSLQKSLSQEQEQRKRLEDQKHLKDKIEAIGTLLSEEETLKYIKEARSEASVAAAISAQDPKSGPSDVSLKAMSKTEQMFWFKNRSSNKTKAVQSFRQNSDPVDFYLVTKPSGRNVPKLFLSKKHRGSRNNKAMSQDHEEVQDLNINANNNNYL